MNRKAIRDVAVGAAVAAGVVGVAVVVRTPQPVCVTGTVPDARCTPGATDPRVTQANIQQTICVPGYTRTVRPPVRVTSQIKKDRIAAYNAPGGAPMYELDHLIPLELGGAPSDIRNLWPEPWDGIEGAHVKDTRENVLHRQVCTGKVTLADAQKQMAADWRR